MGFCLGQERVRARLRSGCEARSIAAIEIGSR